MDSGADLPQVTNVDPGDADPAGGDRQVITGSAFTDATQVLFGDVPAQNFNVISDTQIEAWTPPGTGGSAVPVIVVTPVGQSIPPDTQWSGGAGFLAYIPGLRQELGGPLTS